MRVQLRVDRDRAGGRIGDRPRGAMHELGHDQLGATASVVLVVGLYWRAQPAFSWR